MIKVVKAEFNMMEQGKDTASLPSILAPAGNKASFLSAIAAGADAIYCGLKAMNARMAAVNFTMGELVPLVDLAHKKGVKVYITLNSLLKSEEIATAKKTLFELNRHVHPDALILQDIAYTTLAREVGYDGELHLSTLANVSFPRALALVHHALHVDRVVLPRELTVDEIRSMATACPSGLSLEVFVHGALCFAVSGRCYWSSYMGGKSGLRGKCVQPCRRRYTSGTKTGRLFSCQDLSLDVLCKVLLSIPQIRAWKIEGRRKGPHYVYCTVEAYRLFRDEGNNPLAKKTALDLLAHALGRPGTHYNFLPQRPQNPVNPDTQTGSGLVIGKVQGPRNAPYIIPKDALFSGDLLRIGYEDDSGHDLHRIRRYVPKRGRYFFNLRGEKGPQAGTPVFLVDRLEKALAEKITMLEHLLSPEPNLPNLPNPANPFQEHRKRPGPPLEMNVSRQPGRLNGNSLNGCWLTPNIIIPSQEKQISHIFWWLPPVIWPENEAATGDLIDQLILSGARHFVLNAPWQFAFFPSNHQLDLWAGPFCNLANPQAINIVAGWGFSGVIVAPEMGERDLIELPHLCSIRMGIVISGHWPLCIARGISATREGGTSYTSPKGELAWIKRYGPDEWIFPNWKIDLTEKKELLTHAGYGLLVHLMEPIPQSISMKTRPGLWNWDVGLM